MLHTSVQTHVKLDRLFPAAGFLLLIGVLWLPFGLKRPDRMEGWVLMNHLEQQNSPISQNLDGTGRPLLLLAWFIAHWLDANSFFGAHVLLIGLLFGKALTLYTLLRRIFPEKALFAYLTTALFIVYPADSGKVDTRILNIHMAVFFYLVAVYLLVVFWQSDYRWGGVILTLVVVTLLISLAIYEISYPLVVVAPLILLWLDKHRTRRLILTAGIWYLGPLIYALYWLHGHDGALPAYQQRLLLGNLDPGNIIPQMLTGLLHAYRQNFWGGWIAALQQVNSVYAGLATLTALVTGCLAWLTNRQPQSKNHLWGIGLSGLLILFLGFVPYVLTSLRLETWRVFSYASIGAALTVTALAEWIASRFPARNVVLIVLMTPLLTLGIVTVFNEQRIFSENSLAQAQILTALVKQAPKVNPNTLILLIDDPVDMGAIRAFWANFYFESAVRFLYGNQSIQARICYPNLATWGNWQDRCQLGEKQVIINGGGFTQEVVKPYDKLLAFHYSQAEGVTLLKQLRSIYRPGSGNSAYDPNNVVDFASPLPLRAQTLFPASMISSATSPIASIVDSETIGLGRNWYLAESDGHQTFQWVNNNAEFIISAQAETRINLNLELGPGPGLNYQPFTLDVLDMANRVVATANVQTQATIVLALPLNPGQATVFRLHVAGGGLEIPSDVRIMNFRVFHMRLLPSVF